MLPAWTRFTMIFWAGLIFYAKDNEDPNKFWNITLPNPVMGPSKKPRELVENGPKRKYTYPKEEL